MANHRGKFKWGKYSRYSGSLRAYWEADWRIWDRHQTHWKPEYDFKLYEEWGLLDPEYNGVLADTRDDLPAYKDSVENVYVRYVTNWREVK